MAICRSRCLGVCGAVLHTGATYVLFYFVLFDIGAIYFGPACLAPCLGRVAGRAAGGRPPSAWSLRPGIGAAPARRVGMGAALFIFIFMCFILVFRQNICDGWNDHFQHTRYAFGNPKMHLSR